MKGKQPVQNYMQHYRGGWARMVILAIVVLVVVAGTIAYYYLSKLHPEIQTASLEQTAWNTYYNEHYQFSLQYPSGWTYQEGTTSYGDNPAFDVVFRSSSNPSDSVDVEVLNAAEPATSTAGFFPLAFGADMNIEGITDAGPVMASGTVGEYYENIPGESQYSEALFVHNFQYYGVQDWTDEATFKAMLATFQFTNTWPCVTEPVTELEICTPFSTGMRLVANTSTQSANGTYIDLQLRDPSESTSSFQDGYLSEFGIVVYPNPQHLTLNQWFEDNIDYEGILLKANSFEPVTLSDGSTALAIMNAFPSAWFDVGGPISFEALRLSPSGNEIITIGRSQVVDLSMADYSDLEIFDLELQILGTAKLDSQ